MGECLILQLSVTGGRKKKTENMKLVMVSLRKIVAASHGEKGDDISFLHDAPVESMLAAPTNWCPHPASTSCLRVQGHSMEPTICNGDIVAVDSSQADASDLDGKIVIAWNKDRGLTISRLKRYDHTEVLQPENCQYESITLGHKNKKWKLIARAIWWIRKAS